jgi:hypothetical protein
MISIFINKVSANNSAMHTAYNEKRSEHFKEKPGQWLLYLFSFIIYPIIGAVIFFLFVNNFFAEEFIFGETTLWDFVKFNGNSRILTVTYIDRDGLKDTKEIPKTTGISVSGPNTENYTNPNPRLERIYIERRVANDYILLVMLITYVLSLIIWVFVLSKKETWNTHHNIYQLCKEEGLDTPREVNYTKFKHTAKITYKDMLILVTGFKDNIEQKIREKMNKWNKINRVFFYIIFINMSLIVLYFFVCYLVVSYKSPYIVKAYKAEVLSLVDKNFLSVSYNSTSDQNEYIIKTEAEYPEEPDYVTISFFLRQKRNKD